MELVQQLELLSCTFMLGVICFVQVVHYPLFLKIDQASFSLYETLHQQRTSYVVIAPMSLELLCATLLIYSYRSSLLDYFCFLLLIAIWISTFFIQVPIHTKLSNKYDRSLIKLLCLTNWIRTLGWAVRTGILFFS